MAVDDIRHGIARADVWLTLGWQDIRQRFRRSILGPFWLTLSTAIMLVALGFVYATIFKMELHDYFLPRGGTSPDVDLQSRHRGLPTSSPAKP
jgi:ABC-type polysaccharide/polyol phosphate export permease